MIILATTAATFGHFMIVFYGPVLALLLIGLSYALAFAVLWGCLVYIVDEKLMGKAMGLIVCLMNLGLGLMPMVIGILRDITGNYHSS